ncbi:hypothetical protein Btru_076432 [Bulinus truncatus]|nr:hypothetical protein Btru_076432 [Bulinus truncatus]
MKLIHFNCFCSLFVLLKVAYVGSDSDVEMELLSVLAGNYKVERNDYENRIRNHTFTFANLPQAELGPSLLARFFIILHLACDIALILDDYGVFDGNHNRCSPIRRTDIERTDLYPKQLSGTNIVLVDVGFHLREQLQGCGRIHNVVEHQQPTCSRKMR